MIKILYVIDTIEAPTGGTEKQLLMLLNGLDKTEFKPYLICLRESEWMTQQKFSFPVIIMNFKKIFSFSFVKRIRDFIKLQQKERFDIIQTYFIDANIFGVISGKLSGCKNIIASRRDLGLWKSNIYFSALKFLKIWTKYYLVNSKAVADRIVKTEGVNPCKIKVIYNGLNIDKFKSIGQQIRENRRNEWGINDDEILIGSVANIRKEKNQSSFISAACNLIKEFNNLRFVIVGEGPERKMLEYVINKNNLKNVVHLVGSYIDIIPCLAAFDIAVLCSKTEGFSNSLIEYMAAGLPVIASNVGGNNEAIEHNKTGLLYSVENDNDLVNAIRKLIINSNIGKKLGENAKKTAFSRYDINVCIKEHEDYYLSVTNV